MLAMKVHAVELAMDCSQSLASRRHRPSHAKVRSTTQRRGRTSKPLAASERFMISIVQSPCPLSAARNFSPAYPPSANTWPSQGKRWRMSDSACPSLRVMTSSNYRPFRETALFVFRHREFRVWGGIGGRLAADGGRAGVAQFSVVGH